LAAEGIKNFANRVRIFLVGILLVLMAVGLLNGVLVRRTLQELREQFEGKVRAQAARALDGAGRGRLEADLLRWQRRPADLPRLPVSGAGLRERHLLALELLSPEGVMLAGNVTGEMTRSTNLYELAEGSEQALRRGEAVVHWPAGEGGRDDAVEVFTPVLGRDGAFLAVVRTAHDAAAVRGAVRKYRLVLWSQAAAFAALLVIGLAFARWLVRPLRLVERTTAGEEVSADDDPTNFLLDTYRKVIADLHDKEEALRHLRGKERMRAQRLAALNRSIVDSLLSGVLVVGADGKVREANRLAARILGTGEAKGGDYRRLLEGWPDLAGAVRDCLEEGTPVQRREFRAARQGEAVWIEVSVSPLRGEGEGGALVLVSDLTEIKALERRMQRREMLADLGELSAGVAHEFRNALGTILGYTRMLSRRGEGTEEAGAIEEEVHALERVVRDFLRFADPTRLVLTDIELESLLEEVAGEAGRPGVEVRIEGDLPRIRGDRTLLRRTFRNLLHNAVEAVPEGREGLVEVRGERREGRIRVKIRDNGEGIGGEARERLFQPFFTTKPGGTGLGLALVQKIVLSHNGDIRFDPAPGGGSIFTVTLPLQEEPVGAGRETGDG